MRAVNLIPPEQRRAVRGVGTARVGMATKALLGGLAAAVIAVTVLVLVSNQVSSKRDQLADLTKKQETATAEGNALRPYGNFVNLQRDRYATVVSLSRSRFNWERIVRQLSRVLPAGVWINEFKGSVSGGGSGGSSGSVGGSLAGPSVDLSGCSGSQKDSALVVTRLRNLDGVTSVTLTKSERSTDQGTAAPASTNSSGGSGQQTGCPDYTFAITVGFQAPPAPTPPAPAAGVATASGTTGATGSQGATTQGTTK